MFFLAGAGQARSNQRSSAPPPPRPSPPLCNHEPKYFNLSRQLFPPIFPGSQPTFKVCSSHLKIQFHCHPLPAIQAVFYYLLHSHSTIFYHLAIFNHSAIQPILYQLFHHLNHHLKANPAIQLLVTSLFKPLNHPWPAIAATQQ